MSDTSYLELNRQFMPFKDEKDWELQYTSLGEDGYLGARTWPKILEHSRVVILAEAGAGKTAEFRAANDMLNGKANQTSFYMTLNAVAQCNLYDALETTNDQNKFRSWQANDNTAHFFVDSLDEARLNGETFQKALSNIQKGLSEGISRAKIYISCRVSDWRSISDVVDFKKYLGADQSTSEDEPVDYSNSTEALLAPLFDERKNSNHDLSDDEKTPATPLFVVALAPLSLIQIKEMAAWAGVDKPDVFLTAIHAADATDLANRPQDLLSLVGQWKANGTIGTKHSALKWAIQQRLVETNLDIADRDTLTLNTAYQNAKLLAAQLTLGKQRLLSWPIEASVHTTTQVALNPRDVLPNLAGKDVKRLLNRAIFDPATLGAVRFHHRPTQEILCAEWLLDQIKNGCPIRKIWQLLTEQGYGKTRFRPSLRPVTAWLAQLETRIFERVIEIEPQLLIEGGDPKLISIENRKQLLRKFANLHHGRDDIGISIDISQLAKLTAPELNETIRELWQQSKGSGELRDLLLRMVWIGKLEGLGDIALEAVKSKKRSYETSLAARALEEIGSEIELQQLAVHLKKYARTFPSRAMDAAIKAVFPKYLSLDDLEHIIQHHPLQKRDTIHSGLMYGLEQIAKSLPYEMLEPFTLRLQKMTYQKPLQDNHDERISVRFFSLMSPMILALARIVTEANKSKISPEATKAIRRALRASRYETGYLTGESRNFLNKAVHENRAFNKQLFDFSLDLYAGEEDYVWQFSKGIYNEAWTAEHQDFDVFLSHLSIEEDSLRAICILHTLFGIAEIADDKIKLLVRIRKVIEARSELLIELDKLENPAPHKESNWEKRHKLRSKKLKVKQAHQTKKNKQSWIGFRDKLQQKPSDLIAAPSFGNLYDIKRWIRASQRSDHRNDLAWQRFEFAFGAGVKLEAISALSAFWRTYDPGHIIRKNKTTNGCGVGRLGIEVEVMQNPKFYEALTKEEIRIATNLAWTELNDAPNWAVKIWENRPEVAEGLVREEIRWELKRKTDGKDPFYVLYKLHRVPEPFKSKLAEWILAELQIAEPNNAPALQSALLAITGAQKPFRAELAALAAQRFKSIRRHEHRIIWLAVLIASNAGAGLTALNQWLKAQKSSSDADQLMVDLLATLFPSWDTSYGSSYQNYRKINHLKAFLHLVYKYIRRSDDLEHDTIFTPGARDAAQDARNTIFGYLLDIPGEQTVDAIIELSQSPAFEISKERFEVLADQRATADIDIQPWTAKDVIAFTENFDLKPVSLNKLQSLVLYRLDDIKDEMEAGSFSNKGILRQDNLKRAQERPVQLAIAQQLQLRSGTSYTLVREPEQEDFNEPDILLANAEIGESIPLEIKVADSWSFTQLVEAIEDQLAGKYMKARDATHGILLLTFHDKKTYWEHTATKKRLGFRELERALQVHAIHFVEGQDYIEKIDVVGISLA